MSRPNSQVPDHRPREIAERWRILYCLGTLAYMDGGNTRRETGFCRRLIAGEDRWESVESEYEYAY